MPDLLHQCDESEIKHRNEIVFIPCIPSETLYIRFGTLNINDLTHTYILYELFIIYVE